MSENRETIFYDLTRSRGFTLLEATLVLAILGIVVAGIWIVSANAFAAQKRKQMAEDVINTVANVRDYLKNVDNPSLADTDITALDLLPSDVERNNLARNVYGGQFSVAVTANGTITIVLDTLPSDACVDLLYNHFGGTTNIGAANGTSGNNNTAADMGFLGYGTGTTPAFPPTITDVSFGTVTGNCADPTNNVIYLEFSP